MTEILLIVAAGIWLIIETARRRIRNNKLYADRMRPIIEQHTPAGINRRKTEDGT